MEVPVIRHATILRLGIPLLALFGAACAISIRDDDGDRSRGFASGSRSAIYQVLDEQAAAWNRGDLDAFMDGYWRSPDLVFTSGARVQRGWRTTLDRYRSSYGDSPASMGHLAFHDVEVHPLSDDAAWVLGRWRLEREGGESGGVFTLVFRRIDGRWRIVHDHTSAAP